MNIEESDPAVPAESESDLDPEILRRVREMLRRDLKLPESFPLPLDLPFQGADLDLDSLDLLLLVTSLQRQMGVNIPNENAGREAFANLGALVRYVQNHRPANSATTTPPAAPAPDWLAQLPHGPAFRFVTSVQEVKPGESAVGIWKLDGTEPFFAGHFPNRPLVPGVLIAEALAQVCGLAGPSESGSHGRLAHVDVRFERPVAPPASITLRAKLVRSMGALQQFDVVAESDGASVARGSIALHRGGAEPEPR